MKKRFTESQIVAAIKKQESGLSVKDICGGEINQIIFAHYQMNEEFWALLRL